ncbi:FAD-binding oxidoreductase [Paraburkholderia sp. MPAMCS5]|uniref:NAD(P)/FAD-dependent oxidoreductase n=1 Tax=Paraburkholderia sp. MPAMCS5 TaxID=3112563 RepID=UPI002E17A55F|nr:FAD-binding oxidoreductase [Paraburkholderia sp. MPAMCS5]
MTSFLRVPAPRIVDSGAHETARDMCYRLGSGNDIEPVVHRFQFVTLVFDKPQTVFRLPQWGWPVTRPYNGFSGGARILGWQLMRFYQQNGWLHYDDVCSVNRSVIPLYSLVLATEPLPRQLREQLKLDHRLAFNDMRHLRVYGQVTSEGRLVFGGRGAPYRFGSRMAPEDDLADKVHANIRAAMLEFFPALADARITHRWGGALGVSRDWCPTVSMDRDARIAWAGNYVGDGVATSNLAGRILRNLILGLHDELNRLPVVNHRSPAWEPEPFRWIGVNAGLTAAGFSDFEERVTRQPSRTARVLEKLTGAH